MYSNYPVTIPISTYSYKVLISPLMSRDVVIEKKVANQWTPGKMTNINTNVIVSAFL